jgi:FkbM family methyltransferase
MGHRRMNKHHPLFYRFTPATGPFPPGFDRDFLGCLARAEFSHPPALNPGYPVVDERYFEWIALLESVAEARDSYTMIELGAGFGRWSVRAATAVQRLAPMPVHLIAVEADPVHFGWIAGHFADNGIDPARHTLIRAAVTGGAASRPFLIGSPQGTERPNEWFGQALADWAGRIVDDDAGEYGGSPVRAHENGWRSIDPPVVTLSQILVEVTRVDLVHIDIQGAEHEVLASAMQALNSKVRRILVGTHSREIDEKVQLLLDRHGWECAMAYPCGEISETPWGPVKFGDGVQYRINPRLDTRNAAPTRSPSVDPVP